MVRLGDDVEGLVLEVLRSGMLAQGPMVGRLEAEFAAMVGVEHAVAVNNGTTALIAALQALGIGPGDEVITSPFTFVATLNAILEVGAVARFGDISTDDFNVTATSLESLINGRTRVLMPVHLYGQCADMAAISSLATRHDLRIVEDAAQAFGASADGRGAGGWDVGCFSLYATKNVTSGEGGFVTTADERVADCVRILRNQGMRRRYDYEMPGNNFRLTDLQAAVCLPQLAGYAMNVAARARNATYLSHGLAGLEGYTVPAQITGRGHVWHQYTVLVGPGSRLDRDAVVDGLNERGIGAGVYYPRAVYDYECYREHDRVVVDGSPTAERVARQCLSLPVHQHLGPGELDRIVTVMRELHGE